MVSKERFGVSNKEYGKNLGFPMDNFRLLREILGFPIEFFRNLGFPIENLGFLIINVGKIGVSMENLGFPRENLAFQMEIWGL